MVYWFILSFIGVVFSYGGMASLREKEQCPSFKIIPSYILHKNERIVLNKRHYFENSCNI